jgi:hypothetical protein
VSREREGDQRERERQGEKCCVCHGMVVVVVVVVFFVARRITNFVIGLLSLFTGRPAHALRKTTQPSLVFCSMR